MRVRWKQVFNENLSYKLVSMVIAVILWLTILGRRDFTLSKSIDVEVTVAQQYVLVHQSAESVKVKLTGPRTALKKFMDSNLSQLIAVDLSKKGEGDYEIEVPINKIDVPFGVRVSSVKPSVIKVKVGRKPAE